MENYWKEILPYLLSIPAWLLSKLHTRLFEKRPKIQIRVVNDQGYSQRGNANYQMVLTFRIDMEFLNLTQNTAFNLELLPNYTPNWIRQSITYRIGQFHSKIAAEGREAVIATIEVNVAPDDFYFLTYHDNHSIEIRGQKHPFPQDSFRPQETKNFSFILSYTGQNSTKFYTRFIFKNGQSKSHYIMWIKGHLFIQRTFALFIRNRW